MHEQIMHEDIGRLFQRQHPPYTPRSFTYLRMVPQTICVFPQKFRFPDSLIMLDAPETATNRSFPDRESTGQFLTLDNNNLYYIT